MSYWSGRLVEGPLAWVSKHTEHPIERNIIDAVYSGDILAIGMYVYGPYQDGYSTGSKISMADQQAIGEARTKNSVRLALTAPALSVVGVPLAFGEPGVWLYDNRARYAGEGEKHSVLPISGDWCRDPYAEPHMLTMYGI